MHAESEDWGWRLRAIAHLAIAVKHCCTLLIIALTSFFATGCVLVPSQRERDVVHNPFPQMKRVAVLSFFNQSSNGTIDTDAVSESYYAALQAIPGFEVMPVGVTKSQWLQYSRAYGEPREGADFQRLAQMMGVEAIVVGSVTDYDAYYPPRFAMTTHWYAANEGFHPIPAGYGLPWGTKQEKHIPKRIVQEAEFELARSQLATQTPQPMPSGADVQASSLKQASAQSDSLGAFDEFTEPVIIDGPGPLPAKWPDPSDLIPDGPAPVPPVAIVNHDPVLTHTRLYRGDDAYVTTRLAAYVETGDDARPRGWQGYLNRSDDFVRFCCHLHIVEMLESRGGKDQSDLILQWPLSRY